MADADTTEVVEEPRRDVAPHAATPATRLPLILTLTALLFYFGFQTVQLFLVRGNLAEVKASQEAAIQEAQKVQTQFQTLVSKLSELADQGHAGAKMVMQELLQRGASELPQAPAADAKPPAAAPSQPGK